MDLLGTLRDIAQTGGSSALDSRTDRSSLCSGRFSQRMELSDRRREREVGQDHAEPGVVPDSLGLLVEHRGERAQARELRVQVLPGFERMARAYEVRQPVVGAIHLAHDIGARPQVDVDEAVAPELIGECRVDELCDVVVQPRGCAERRAIDARQLRERRLDGPAVVRDRLQRTIVEPTAQRRVVAGVASETGRLFRAASQVLLGETLQQRGERRVGDATALPARRRPSSASTDRRLQQLAPVEACRTGFVEVRAPQGGMSLGTER